LSLALLFVSPAVGDIVPGDLNWTDSSGNRIESHGAGIIQVNGAFYWFGESTKTQDLKDHGINCYSSKDLLVWKFEGQVLHQQDITGVGKQGPYVVERPKVIYSTHTNKYVMWFHLDDDYYDFGHVGIATSDTVNGHYSFVHSIQPDNLDSHDQTLFQDEDGSAYHIRTIDNQYVGISQLSEDYLSTTGVISKIEQGREGVAMFKRNGKYYLATSHVTWWNPNPMEVWTTDSTTLKGAKWSSLGNPTNDDQSFHSQPAFILPYHTQNGTVIYIYMGDRWLPHNEECSEPWCPDLLNACYIWLPIGWNADKPSINWRDHWSPS